MIGWLVIWGLSLLGCDPAASERYAGLADRFATQFQLAYETPRDISSREPVDLGAAYAEATGAARRLCADALDVYLAAIRSPPHPPAQARPDIGAFYAGAAGTVRRVSSSALDAYSTAMRAPPRTPPQVEPGDRVLGSVISAASRQFDLPEPWIHALIHVESEGDAGAVSPKGAMGLTQIMPATYAYLSDRYDLGKDPYAPRDNILAGSAYLREMYDHYGPTGFLAAYNAGPGRYEDYLSRRCDLPDETKRYVAAVRLAIGEALFTHPNSRFYEPIAISSRGELLLGKTNQPLPVDERLALHSLVAKAVERTAGKK